MPQFRDMLGTSRKYAMAMLSSGQYARDAEDGDMRRFSVFELLT
jgi:hypothetical protein